ncbi:MAG: tetratricopeptide repeat protein [Gloeobacterales cyanobacterium]
MKFFQQELMTAGTAGSIALIGVIGLSTPAWADRITDMIRKANTLADNGYLSSAITTYRSAAELDSEKKLSQQNASLYYNMGLLMAQEGKKEEARDAFRQALAIKPDHFKAQYNLALILDDLGEKAKAQEAFGKALGMASANAPMAQEILQTMDERNLTRK